MNSREAIKALEGDGWFEVRHVGDHKQFHHPTKPGAVTVQHPKKDLSIKNVKSIEKQAGIKLR